MRIWWVPKSESKKGQKKYKKSWAKGEHGGCLKVKVKTGKNSLKEKLDPREYGGCLK